MKKLQRHYDKLTDVERFRAVMAAWERDDESEIRALVNTAPKATYRMTAWPYRGMPGAIQSVVWCVVTDILAGGLLMFMSWGVDRARSAKVHYGDDDAGDYDGLAWEHCLASARAALAEWDALALFCDELGVTREQVMTQAPVPPALETALEFARTLLEGEERVMTALAQEVCETEEKAAKVLAERATNLAEQRAEKVRETADLLKQIWEQKVER